MGVSIENMFAEGFMGDATPDATAQGQPGNTSNDVAVDANRDIALDVQQYSETDEQGNPVEPYNEYNDYENPYTSADYRTDVQTESDNLDDDNLNQTTGEQTPTNTVDASIDRYILPELSKPIVLTNEQGEEVEVKLTAEDLELAAWNKHHNLQQEINTILETTTSLVKGYQSSELGKYIIDAAAKGVTDAEIYSELFRLMKEQETENLKNQETQYLTPEEKKQLEYEKRLQEAEQKLKDRDEAEARRQQQQQQETKIKATVEQNVALIQQKIREDYNIDRDDLNPAETALLKKSLQDLYARTDANGKVLRDKKTNEVLFYGIGERNYTTKEMDGILNYAFNLLPKKILAGRVALDVDMNTILQPTTATPPTQNQAASGNQLQQARQMVSNANIPKVAGANVSTGGKQTNSTSVRIMNDPKLTRHQKIDRIFGEL